MVFPTAAPCSESSFITKARALGQQRHSICRPATLLVPADVHRHASVSTFTYLKAATHYVYRCGQHLSSPSLPWLKGSKTKPEHLLAFSYRCVPEPRKRGISESQSFYPPFLTLACYLIRQERPGVRNLLFASHVPGCILFLLSFTISLICWRNQFNSK